MFLDSFEPETSTTEPESQVSPKAPVLTPEALGLEIVSLYVSPARRQIMVHEKLLYDHARFLLEKYNSAFTEGKEHVIYLPEEDTDTTTRLVDWLYRKAVPLEKLLALDLYYLAEKFCISALMNHATANAIFTTWDVQEIYHNTHEMSRLHFDSAAQIACSLRNQRHRMSWVAAESEECSKFSPDVFRDVFHISINHWDDVHDDGTWPNTETSRNAFGTCDFHAHEKGEKCNGPQ